VESCNICPSVNAGDPHRTLCRLHVIRASTSGLGNLSTGRGAAFQRFNRSTASPTAFQQSPLSCGRAAVTARADTSSPGLPNMRDAERPSQSLELSMMVADRPVVTFSTGLITEARRLTPFEPEPESGTISSCKSSRPAHYAQLGGPPRAPARFTGEDPADQRFALSQSAIRSCASWTQQPQLPVTQ
jgi:hypothetical protein